LALRWENINLATQTAFLPLTKNGTSRTVPLSKKAVAILEGLPNCGEEGPVFPISFIEIFFKKFQLSETGLDLPRSTC
jgi:integrase